MDKGKERGVYLFQVIEEGRAAKQRKGFGLARSRLRMRKRRAVDRRKMGKNQEY